MGCSETRALSASSRDGARGACAHFPERATETRGKLRPVRGQPAPGLPLSTFQAWGWQSWVQKSPLVSYSGVRTGERVPTGRGSSEAGSGEGCLEELALSFSFYSLFTFVSNQPRGSGFHPKCIPRPIESHSPDPCLTSLLTSPLQSPPQQRLQGLTPSPSFRHLKIQTPASQPSSPTVLGARAPHSSSLFLRCLPREAL